MGDGFTLNAKQINVPGSTANFSLIIYAQSRGESAGKLTITANNSNAHINLYSGSITINGGQITVNGNTAESGIKWASMGSIALGYKKQDNFITAAHYLQASSPAAPKIAEGKAFAVMTGDDFTTLIKIIDSSTALTASELDGKKLVPAFTVTFNANGGTGDTYTQNVRYNTATALTANAFTRTGYTFNSWNTKQDGSGTPYADKATITLTENVTLYAQWQQQETTPPAATLSAIEVSVTGESTLTTTEGTSATSAYTAGVTGKYSDGTSKTLSASDYSIAWTLDKDISGISINNGTLSVNNSVSAGTYARTITANATQDSVTGSGTRSVNITVNGKQEEQAPEAVSLESLGVSITGSDSLTVTEHETLTSTYTASVTGTYSDSTTKTLTASDYSLEWTLEPRTNGVSISDGTLRVSDSALAGKYTFTITVKATHDSITGSFTKGVNLEVLERKKTTDAEYLDNLTTEEKNAVEHPALSDNLEGCTNLVSLDISRNHFGWFDYDPSNLSSMNYFDCHSQDMTILESTTAFNFGQFFNSGDITVAGVRVTASAYIGSIGNVTAYNESGDRIASDYDPQTGVATFESAPAMIKYLYDTGFDDLSMDVTINALTHTEEQAPTPEPLPVPVPEPDNLLGPSSGCNSGLGAYALILAVLMITKKL